MIILSTYLIGLMFPLDLQILKYLLLDLLRKSFLAPARGLNEIIYVKYLACTMCYISL